MLIASYVHKMANELQMLIGTKDGSIDQHCKVCIIFQYFGDASLFVYVQITNLLVAL
jgi:hypothetical protein